MLSSATPLEVVPLPDAARGWREQVERYVEKRTRESLSARHLRETRRVLTRTGELLEDQGLLCHPGRLGDVQLDFLLNGPWRPPSETRSGLSPRTRLYHVCVLNGFLKEHGNLLVERRRLRFPESPVRPRRALDPDQAQRLLEAASRRGIVPHGFVAFEMLMGLRRSEVLRISLVDLEDEALRVHGKGRAGGKTRWVPYHSEVKRILPDLLANRAQLMDGYRGPDPGRLFVHRTKSGIVRPWGLWYVDERLMRPVFEDAGVRMSWNLNHALRRTFGRTLWTKGVPLEVISDLLGHQDTKTTIRYLALRKDDMVSAMRVLDQALPPLQTPSPEAR
jgi:integrase